jgi:hypothetical protein
MVKMAAVLEEYTGGELLSVARFSVDKRTQGKGYS